MIIGIDEVGRGSWAGPLVMGAAVLDDQKSKIEGLTDSKKLTKRQREKLAIVIKQQAVWWGLGWVEVAEINQIGLSQALRLAARRSIADLPEELSNTQIIIDGTIDFLDDHRVSTLKKADLLVPSVSAAAILAKVSRDEFMVKLSAEEAYCQFGFERHVGYGTKLHRQAIDKYGLCDQHRTCFKPMSEMINLQSKKPVPSLQTTKQTGDEGEDLVADHLAKQSYEILARNWRTDRFEVDIVAKKDRQIFVIEVKTRKNADFGGGLAAINHQKLTKLKLAAETILHKYPQFSVVIMVADVTSDGSIKQLFEL